MAKKRVTGPESASAAASARSREPRKASVKQAAALPSAEPVFAAAATAPESISNGASPYEPTQDEIARLAYTYWESRGCLGGSPEQDWTRAERELRSRVLVGA